MISIEELDTAYQEYVVKNNMDRASDLTRPFYQWQLREDKDRPCMIFLMGVDRFEDSTSIKVEKHVINADGWTTLPVWMRPDYVPVKPAKPMRDTKPIDLLIEMLEELQQAGVTDITTWKAIDSDSFETLNCFSIPSQIKKA
jgi:hypothetical protein